MCPFSPLSLLYKNNTNKRNENHISFIYNNSYHWWTRDTTDTFPHLYNWCIHENQSQSFVKIQIKVNQSQTQIILDNNPKR